MQHRWRSFIGGFCLFGLLPTIRAKAQWIPANPVTHIEKQSDGVLFTLETGTLKLQICTDSIVRVIYAPTWPLHKRPDYVVTKTDWPSSKWSFESSDKDLTVTTGRLKFRVDKADGLITYSDANGKIVMAEGPKEMRPAVVNGEHTYHAEDVIKIYGSHEAFYGLGQHQAGVWNYRGESVDLSQDNTNISVPLFLSSNGYGVFWNNTSVSRFNNRFVHYLFLTSEVADAIDYYFLYGPDFDRIIAEYRELTGVAPLFGKWAYGYWQSKNKYASQQELLATAEKYRQLHIPIDNIVQDWFWWTRTGEFKFNEKYPDPKAMIDQLHRDHFHLMISVWPFFDPGSQTYTQMDQRGYFLARTAVAGFHPKGAALYDASNPAARKFYWDLIDTALFKIGADAWWLDTTEPETEGREENVLLDHNISIGNGARYANIYSLLTTMGVYQGQRSETDQKRVFILSRSAFAGIQRYGVTAWSGDVLSDFLTYKRQIPAGLNFALSGIPYWTTDIGGFILGHPDDRKYRELFVRWFQFGAFCPIFRVHGTRAPDQNELWSYGAAAQSILTSFDRLRYRLMPYIYSLAWKVTNEGYTHMRPLVMDFREDVKAQNTGDEFMFGPAILVNPVTEQGANTRRVYLPGARWYDFWTGATRNGEADVDAEAPLSRIPLYVRAGSIIPMGPDLQFAEERPADPIELRVYPGADGDFTLYEDDNNTYDYEKGAYAAVPIHWNNSARTLTIADRKGRFPGMLESRTLNIVFAGAGHGTGVDISPQPDKVVRYKGKLISVSQ
ncbi:MAG: glycoside hydrolase family 31 protein [Acidobacteriaceae bacterium]|nr:glycoside hydrolase family 31 protein [Acidobacteriaceae bacterium]MBV9780354.1 glycoside hydrolase family 31 protein [Acidobacteriaceae bacterium]